MTEEDRVRPPGDSLDARAWGRLFQHALWQKDRAVVAPNIDLLDEWFSSAIMTGFRAGQESVEIPGSLAHAKKVFSERQTNEVPTANFAIHAFGWLPCFHHDTDGRD
jgi:hypothetical protein